MEPVTVLLGMVTCIVAVGTPLVIKEFKELRKLYQDNYNRQTVVETKLDMLLDRSGFDMRKVNRAIKENIEELKQNDKPSVGCINIKELLK